MEDAVASEIQRLRQRAERERNARLQAESVAEAGTRQIYERQRQLELLQVITDAANSSDSPESCMQTTLREWCHFTSWPVGHAYVARENPLRAVPTTLWHFSQPASFGRFRDLTEATEMAPGVGLPGKILRSGRSVWIVDVLEDPVFVRREVCSDLNLRGAFGFPVRIGKEVVAALEFFSTRVEEPNEEWLSLATQVGTQIGRVFERQRARLALQAEVEERQRAEAELKAIQPRLIAASRDVGRAEVATGVLHNVGNVLNSVNISLTELREILAKSNLPLLAKTLDLIADNEARLGEFFSSDAKGKALPAFLRRLNVGLTEEWKRLQAEAEGMERHLTHIKSVVKMQQSYARAFGMIEQIDPAALMEEAIALSGLNFEKHNVALQRDFHPAPPVLTDRHKSLQILINLLRNAKQAVLQAAAYTAGQSDRRIILTVRELAERRVLFAVTDSGVGIAAENLPKIFRHGFTTKGDGHGFGLHTSALAAQELKGSLTASSAGPGKGATFSLELPTADIA